MSDKKHRRLKRCNENTNKRIWTNDDKCMLLKGLKKYGHTDIPNLSKMLPNKSPGGIKAMINKLILKSQGSKNNTKSCINKWLQDDMFRDKETLVPQALLLIHMFEKHPSPKEAIGCNFRDAYYFLYRMMLGYPPVNVSIRTRETIYFLLSKITKGVRSTCDKEALEHLSSLCSKHKNNKVYPGKRKANDIDAKDVNPRTM